ncbi:hypothetical protein SAY87_027007 [Trapa incisa]|uniref:Auxin-responsive protein n=1 Tax=Trapa incisa TaxID=236973 RepID=A0AAN7JMF8_9MYRT|nr:hypothetical protein SAY87_027007 [Trapa incisa]
MAFEGHLNLEATELRLGLPGSGGHEKRASRTNKRGLPESPESDVSRDGSGKTDLPESTRPAKAQVVGWPPVRTYRKNCLQQKKAEPEQAAGVYIKVSMDGVPYLRKIDLKVYSGYPELLEDLEGMFKFKAASSYKATLIIHYVHHFLQEAENHEGLRGDVREALSLGLLSLDENQRSVPAFLKQREVELRGSRRARSFAWLLQLEPDLLQEKQEVLIHGEGPFGAELMNKYQTQLYRE